MNKVSRFKQITNEMVNLYERKNSDYGSSVNDTYKKYGMVSYLVRMEDKMNRIRNIVLNGNQKVEDERIKDSLLDLAVYSVLALIEEDEE